MSTVNSFPPNIDGYVQCGLGIDTFMFMGSYDVALLVHADDIVSADITDFAKHLSTAKFPVILAIRMLRATTIKELTLQFAKSLAERGTPKSSTSGFSRISEFPELAGALPVGCLLRLVLVGDKRVQLSRQGGVPVVVEDGELVGGLRRTFWGPKPTVPSLVANMTERIFEVVAKAKRIHDAAGDGPSSATASFDVPQVMGALEATCNLGRYRTDSDVTFFSTASDHDEDQCDFDDFCDAVAESPPPCSEGEKTTIAEDTRTEGSAALAALPTATPYNPSAALPAQISRKRGSLAPSLRVVASTLLLALAAAAVLSRRYDAKTLSRRWKQLLLRVLSLFGSRGSARASIVDQG